jgi:hypothetical protein
MPFKAFNALGMIYSMFSAQMLEAAWFFPLRISILIKGAPPANKILTWKSHLDWRYLLLGLAC